MSVSQPVLNTPGAGEVLEFGNGSSAEIVVGQAESDGEYAVVRYQVRPGDEPPLHTHTREDEMVYVVDGEITAIVGDTEVDVGPGAFAALPRNVPHTIRVKGESATLVLTFIPAGLERFFVPNAEEHSDPATFGLEIRRRSAVYATRIATVIAHVVNRLFPRNELRASRIFKTASCVKSSRSASCTLGSVANVLPSPDRR